MAHWLTKAKPGIRPLPPGTAFSNPHVLIATWFGAGRLKPGSGTIGSLAAIPFGYLITVSTGYLGLALAAALLFWVGTLSANYYGEKSGEKDNQAIVVDEVIGMWIAAIPAENNLFLWLIAFVLFRIMDIYKPWPASFFDNRAGNGMDVLLDDVIAGFYAFLGVAGYAAYLAQTTGGQ